MSIDEKAFKAAMQIHKDEVGVFAPGICRRMLEAYEAAKASGQPDECRAAYDQWWLKKATTEEEPPSRLEAFTAGWESRASVRESSKREFEIGKSELDFALWHHVKWGFTPKHQEECFIRSNGFAPVKATYDAEYAVFHAGDGEVHLSKVEWQSIFPESTIERAARNLNQIEGEKP